MQSKVVHLWLVHERINHKQMHYKVGNILYIAFKAYKKYIDSSQMGHSLLSVLHFLELWIGRLFRRGTILTP